MTYETVVVNKRFGEWVDVRDFIRPNDPMVAQVVDSQPSWTLEKLWAWVLENIRYPHGDLDRMDTHVLVAYLDERTGAQGQRYVARDFWNFPAETLRDMTGDCFTGDTRILCIEDDRYRVYTIRELESKVGKIQVLSYNWETQRFEAKPVTRFFRKGQRPVVRVRLGNGGQFRCTLDHRFFAVPQRSVVRGKPVVAEKRLSEVVASNRFSAVEALIVARELPELRAEPQPPPAQLWLEGAYAAEGYATKGGKHSYKVAIANDDPTYRAETIANLEALGVPYTPSRRLKHAYVTVRASWLRNHLVSMGTNSFDMSFPWDRLSASKEQLLVLLDGYARGDGYLRPRRRNPSGGQDHVTRIYQTSSGTLAIQLQLLHLVLGRPLYVWHQQRHGGAGKQPIWRLYENTNSVFNRPVSPGLSRAYIREVEDAGEEEVFDIEVADNHNFVLADGWVVAHNCEDGAFLLTSMIRRALPRQAVYATAGWFVPPQAPGRLFGHVWVSVPLANGSFRVLDTTLRRLPNRVVVEGPPGPYRPILRWNDRRVEVLDPSLDLPERTWEPGKDPFVRAWYGLVPTGLRTRG